MEKIILKNSELEVSRLCFGGCPMGGYGWGNVSEEELIKAVRCAVEQGINFFDNADTYGLGKSEETLSRALGDKRHQVVIGTKFGVRVEDGKTFYDNSPEWIEQALAGSLKRLNTDYIDLYQVHYRDGKTPISVVVDTLEKMRQKGYIRYYGLSNIYHEDLEELKGEVGMFVSFQDEYSLACRKNESDMMELSEQLQLTPLTWGSLGQGILSGKYDKNSTFGADDRRSRKIYVNFHGDKLLKNLEIVEVLKEIAQEVGKTVPAVAIRWILDYLTESAVIVGIKNQQQLYGNMDALGWKLSEEQLKRLEEVSR